MLTCRRFLSGHQLAASVISPLITQDPPSGHGTRACFLLADPGVLPRAGCPCRARAGRPRGDRRARAPRAAGHRSSGQGARSGRRRLHRVAVKTCQTPRLTARGRGGTVYTPALGAGARESLGVRIPPPALPPPADSPESGCDPRSGLLKVREIIELLEDDGWLLAATRGSHRQFKHPSKPGRVTVAGRPAHDLHAKTLGSIPRQAGLRQ